MHDCVLWCRSKKRAEEICSFNLCGKEIFFKYGETKSKEEKKRTGAKRMHIKGRAYDTRLGGDGYRGAVTAGDGSNQKGRGMVAAYVNLRGKRKRQQRKVGHEEE